jgi:hypothetical protein
MEKTKKFRTPPLSSAQRVTERERESREQQPSSNTAVIKRPLIPPPPHSLTDNNKPRARSNKVTAAGALARDLTYDLHWRTRFNYSRAG